MTPSFTIRPFAKDTLQQPLSIWNHPEQHHRCSESVFREKVYEDPDVLDETRLVGTIGNQPVGFCVGALRRHTLRGHIKMIAVDPAHCRRGIGSALLAEVEQALAAATIGAIRVDEAAPNYLTPGIDQRNTVARSFFEAHGYVVIGEAQNMSVDLAGRDFGTTAEELALAQQNITIRRATANDREAVDELLSAHWEAWKGEVHTAMQNHPIALHIAVRDNAVVAFSAYDGNNRGTGWFGPMGTDPAATGQGIGRVLLLRCLADLQSQGLKSSIIPWVGPVGFYEQHCHAVTSDKFWRMEKPL